MDVLRLRAALSDAEIETLVARFYERVAEDDLLAPVFAARVAAADWPAHLGRMVAFWSTILRGTDRYNGDPMAPHRELEGLGEPHMQRWLAMFRETAEELLEQEVADSICMRAERMGAQLRKVMGLS